MSTPATLRQGAHILTLIGQKGDDKFLPVNYDQSLGAMITAGNYGYVDSDIVSKKFPIEGSGIVEFEFELVHPNHNTSTDYATAATRADSDPANPWEPAKIEHLLAFGAAFPELQRKLPIVGLGSVAKSCGRRNVPCLSGDGSRRVLCLNWIGNGWLADYRFLRVRKKVSAS